jgi:hypothetical protein
MKKISSFVTGWFLLLAASSPSGYAQPFTFNVKHDHLRGHCIGKLIIDQGGIEYDTENSKDRRKWSYHDLKRIEISSRKELNLFTYEDLKYRFGAEKKFEFELAEGEITPDIYQFLLSKVTRPILTRVAYPSTPFLFTLPVKHRHLLGGCQGELKVGEDRVVYETRDPEDSRIWFYKDMESIGLLDAYSFRLTTTGENYTFDLKVPISNQQYEFLWDRVYRLQNLYPENAQPRLHGITGSGIPRDSGVNRSVGSSTDPAECARRWNY